MLLCTHLIRFLSCNIMRCDILIWGVESKLEMYVQNRRVYETHTPEVDE